MNWMNLTGNYGMTTIVVLAWLSLYFILVIWIFLYRYFSLNAMIQREKKNVESLLKGKNVLIRDSAFNLNGIDRQKSESLLQYFLNKTIKEATIGLTFLGIVASTAPFIGLFGTVVEILEAFSKLGMESKATLDVIAPIISKALIATAAGILTAIPAYSFNLFLKRKVFDLNTYLQLQVNLLAYSKDKE
ncbi:MotA/TolQ/ExbB proton channel family protein [Helicobacter canadensis]|uniref:ExbB / TolQ family transport protein n=1 Tax=Helicobacter canadensis MIT 98-5491 TaxID=537970 RepID=C5ZWS1_9HELI|nr:MotA/TolQ/ExbB proton channel family protein [Helicobacter canadensis]EES89589.1 ExbB / TolQ family transport protein [Helicobacter canadensis MIT 98-5491]EFR48380.1 transporter, MotA/TolQ/ExbB proton channel family protein [Helicobacter canadensis MIT 98-5491]STO99626.1 motA/TolQ/ExbB proton channel family protein [Helicobacter canadensis]